MSNQSIGIRVALVGCGAIAQAHARALAVTSGASCTALFDVDSARAELLRKVYCPAAEVVCTISEIAERADAAIVAVPNAYHAPISKTLLRAGVHVLCEKPLATSLTDAEEMAAIAREEGRILTCGLIRRFYNSTSLVSTALRRELVGPPLRFEATESVWNWPVGRATFDRKIAGGGMLIDISPHIFDLAAVWFGPVEIVEYRDDNRGGVEAEADIKVRCEAAGGHIYGNIFLSRAYRTPNRVRIFCSRGRIDVDPHQRDAAIIVFNGEDSSFSTMATVPTADPFAEQLHNFLEAIKGWTEPIVTAEAAIETIALVESCYQKRRPISHPWTKAETSGTSRRRARHSYKKILVTGAAGVIGSRLVELWAEEDRLSDLRCMVRGYRTAARMMRFPVEVVEADLLDKSAIKQAALGCDAIIHLGVGEKAGRETQSILDVARELGIRRFVHLSSVSVYGRVIPASVERLQEQSKVTRTGEPYADEKAKAERAVMRACRYGLEGVILRPQIVYGPGLRWSAELMELLAQGKVPIVEDGGWGNLIYVDDLVEAIDCALLAEGGFGEPLFIIDGVPIRWSDYIASHAGLVGAFPARIARAEALKSKRSWREWLVDSGRPLLPLLRTPEFRTFFFESPAMRATAFRLYLALRNSRSVRPYLESFRTGSTSSSTESPHNRQFDEMWTALQLSEARLSPSRAEAMLGFRAQVDFAEGFRRTTEWFKRYQLIPSNLLFDERESITLPFIR